MEFIQFVLNDFFRFVGFIVILVVIFKGITDWINAIRKR